MMKMLVAIAIGAGVVSTPVFAQGANNGFMMRDQTRQEALQRADMLFQMLDANHDGTVTRAEAEAAAAQFAASRGGENGSRGMGRMQRMIDQLFGTSQSLTRQQFEAQALARFDALDLNHDGVVTATERQQARQQRSPVPPTAQDPAQGPAQPPRQ